MSLRFTNKLAEDEAVNNAFNMDTIKEASQQIENWPKEIGKLYGQHIDNELMFHKLKIFSNIICYDIYICVEWKL